MLVAVVAVGGCAPTAQVMVTDEGQVATARPAATDSSTITPNPAVQLTSAATTEPAPQPVALPTATNEPATTRAASATPTPTSGAPRSATAEPDSPSTTIVARSAGGRPIPSYRLGSGETVIAVIGGIHGGYEWNSILLAEALLDYYRARTEEIPVGIALDIIPNANPDGLYAVTGFDGPFTAADIATDSTSGRFNGNDVDLNRNWDCNWSAAALWRDQTVSGGEFPFSEPETSGLRDYLLNLKPVVVVFLHSAADAIYVSGCPDFHAPSYALAQVYGQASGYPINEFFDHYPVTGDAGDWLTMQGIPSFTVELYSHESLDWERNLAGLSALLGYYAAQTPSASLAPTVTTTESGSP
jgi:hypothetical protein